LSDTEAGTFIFVNSKGFMTN